jgi:hypothetical protein
MWQMSEAGIISEGLVICFFPETLPLKTEVDSNVVESLRQNCTVVLDVNQPLPFLAKYQIA